MIKNYSKKKSKKKSDTVKQFYDNLSHKNEPLEETINKPSDEQNLIINSVNNYNIIVDAIPGSGKTTTALHIAKHYPTLRILLLTYNKKIRFETKYKASFWKIGTNLSVHTYHSFCCKYYDHNTFTDTEIKVCIDKKSLYPFTYDMIIIDECQDMTPLYYELVLKIINDNILNNKIKLCILGDKYQCIYSYNDSDPRFILYSNKLFEYTNSFQWKSLKLSKSYRLSDNIANFINMCVLGEERIICGINKSNNKVRYLICDTMLDSCENIILKEIKNYLSIGYKFSDIFILAPSINNIHLKIIEKLLTNENIFIHVPTCDDIKLDENILRHKIVISSYHQTKGLERKIVILYGFDDSYFDIQNKANKFMCPNDIYVALTRPSERLSIIHNYKKKFLPFVNPDLIRKFCYVCEEIPLNQSVNINIQSTQFKGINQSVTGLLRRIPQATIEKITHLIKSKQITCSGTLSIRMLPSKTLQINDIYDDKQCMKENNNLTETVNEITGIAIPAYYQFITTNTMYIFNELKRSNNKTICSMILNNKIDAPTMLKIANEYCSMVSGYSHKTKQIINYDWISIGQFKKISAKLKEIISSDSIYETRLCLPFTFMHNTEYGEKNVLYNLNGCVDCIDNDSDTIYEFKCINPGKNYENQKSNEILAIEHFIQLAIYKYMFLTIRNNVLENLHKYTVNYKVNDHVIIYRNQSMQLENCDVIDEKTKSIEMPCNTKYDPYNFKTGIIKNINNDICQISIKHDHLFTKTQMKTYNNNYEIKSKVLIIDTKIHPINKKCYSGMTGIIVGNYKNKYKVSLNEIFTFDKQNLINKTQLENDFGVKMLPQYIFRERVPKFKLMNILTCEIHELNTELDDLVKIIKLLFDKDQHFITTKNDNDFFKTMNIIKNKYNYFINKSTVENQINLFQKISIERFDGKKLKININKKMKI